MSLAGAVRAEIRTADSTVPVARVGTLERWMDDFLNARRFETVLLFLFAAAALALSAVGIFGLLHYFVVQRKREIGVRMALGAQRSDILTMVLRKALQLSFAGTLIGVLGGIGANLLEGLSGYLALLDQMQQVLADLRFAHLRR